MVQRHVYLRHGYIERRGCHLGPYSVSYRVRGAVTPPRPKAPDGRARLILRDLPVEGELMSPRAWRLFLGALAILALSGLWFLFLFGVEVGHLLGLDH